jgi:NDP-sugar pyrophosphorylase family protein
MLWHDRRQTKNDKRVSGMAEVHAIIQAGGAGQRISSVANGLPKPMLAVGGIPMIERLVRQLADSGIGRITVVIGPNGDSIRTRVSRVVESLPRIRLDFHEERVALGNAGVLAEIDTGHDDVLLCFADLVTDLDFNRLRELHARRGCNVTLTSHWEHHQLTLGELVVEGDTVRGYVEKPRKAFLICSGIALFDARAMAVARTLARPFGISNLVAATISAGCSVTHWEHRAYWIDVNTPELLARARDEEAAQVARAEAPAEALVRRQAG